MISPLARLLQRVVLGATRIGHSNAVGTNRHLSENQVPRAPWHPRVELSTGRVLLQSGQNDAQTDHLLEAFHCLVHTFVATSS